MDKPFVEMLLFQVKPDKIDAFERFLESLKAEQAKQIGCTDIKCFKRFYTFDGVERGDPPKELTKIVKCVKYYLYWEFDSIDNCGKANGWFFNNYYKEISKLLIAPFDINSGYSV